MRDKAILDGIRKYFKIQEFVDEQTFNKFGQKAWQFLDPRLLHTILIIRRKLDKGITANTWSWGGKFDERGLRSNMCSIVKKKSISQKLYLSAHTMGRALDFDVKGMSAEEVRDWIIANEDILPYKIRLEHKYNKSGRPISWVHLDMFYYENNSKIHMFNI